MRRIDIDTVKLRKLADYVKGKKSLDMGDIDIVATRIRKVADKIDEFNSGGEEMCCEDKQTRLDEMMQKYKDITSQINNLADELDDQYDAENEILHDADMICTIYKKFIDAGMSYECAYNMTTELLGF